MKPAMKLLDLPLRGAIRLYQLVVSPLSPPRCRYLPTCSEYAIEALARHGALAGTRLAIHRILRCHPWSDWGYDPVPDATPRPSSRGAAGRA